MAHEQGIYLYLPCLQLTADIVAHGLVFHNLAFKLPVKIFKELYLQGSSLASPNDGGTKKAQRLCLNMAYNVIIYNYLIGTTNRIPTPIVLIMHLGVMYLPWLLSPLLPKNECPQGEGLHLTLSCNAACFLRQGPY